MLKLRCPGCARVVEIPHGIEGKKIRCAGCWHGWRVPAKVPLPQVKQDEPWYTQPEPSSPTFQKGLEKHPRRVDRDDNELKPQWRDDDVPPLADWFYLCGGEIVGPLSANDLRDQFLAGQLTPETPVRRGGEGNWVPAKKVKGLCDAPPPPPPAPVPPPPVAAAPPPPPPQHPEPSHRSSPAPAKSGGGAGKSIALFLIGGVLLVVAFMMNADLDQKEKLDIKINTSVGDFVGALGGRYEYKETKKQDRVGVYAVGGIGAMFILGGFVTLGGNKK